VGWREPKPYSLASLNTRQTIPELAIWHERRIDDIPTDEALTRRHELYPLLNTSSFPLPQVELSAAFAKVSWEPPFANHLAHGHPSTNIMIVQSWLLLGGSEVGMLSILRHFAELGYRVTMVLTRSRWPEGG
jgi:hypothetical protein